jgi:N-acetyl-anhydromuramyl-L-alanine amidase AmpD
LISKGDFMLNVSAHYLVDREGAVFSLMPDNVMARHAMGLNHISIGIENVGTGRATAAQIESNVKLVSYLMRRYGIKRIISHTEVEKLRDAKDPLYVEKVPEFFRHKECGENITDQVRKRLEL